MFCDFIEIGTSDFDTFIQTTNESSIGISIEPIKYYLDNLPNKKNCIKENVAISNYNGKINIYYVPVENIKKYELPKWVRGCNSVNQMHPTVKDILIDNNLDPEEIFSVDTVNVCQLHDIIKKYNVSGIYHLKIDTEGHDTIILNNYLDNIHNNNLLPHKILFESNKLTNPLSIKNTIDRLVNIGYTVIYTTSSDTSLELNINSVKNKIGFTDPIYKYYLVGYPANYNFKDLPHSNTLEGAKQYCVDNNCGGVTYQYNRYEVRLGNKLLPYNDNNLVSWIYL